MAFVPEITRYKVICGSNGKVGTRYNVIKIPKEEKGRVIKKTVIDNSTVGRRLTDEEFVNMYPSHSISSISTKRAQLVCKKCHQSNIAK